MSALANLIGFAKRFESPDSLEGILLELAMVSDPWVHRSWDGTWSCFVEMHMRIAGTQFNVKSEYGHKTPTSAALECLERVREVARA